LESAFALPAETLHRVENAILVVRSFFVVSDFNAKSAMRIRVFGITFNAYGTPRVIHLDQHCARIRAIVRTDSSYCLHMDDV
jgi:hypothetical protein